MIGIKKIKSLGFTLIELLVVTAIVAILSAILLPVITQAKRASYKSVCYSNLKQIYFAMDMYATDYDEYYLNTNDLGLFQGRRFRWPIASYVVFTAKYNSNDPNGPSQFTGNKNNILACPSDLTDVNLYDKTSYGYSACFYISPEVINMQRDKFFYKQNVPCSSISRADVLYPSKKAMVADWAASHEGKTDGWWSFVGARNLLFADGHIKYTRASDMNVANDGFPDINLTVDGVMGKDIE